MELPNSGGNTIEFWCPDLGEWQLIENMRFEEARTYQWRTSWETPFEFHLNHIPLPMVRSNLGWTGELTMPFQSGKMRFYIDQLAPCEITIFVYPDDRKITEDEHAQMISDILNEAVACFQFAGAHLQFDSNGSDRRLSLPQWDYIERTFYRLRRIIQNIVRSPIRKLDSYENLVRRENITSITPTVIKWIEAHTGDGALSAEMSIPIPSKVYTNIKEDSCNVYENRVLVRWLREFRSLLKKYEIHSPDPIKSRAAEFRERVSYWLRLSPLQQISEHKGTISITQAFRKHPIYRMAYDWFKMLYQFGEFRIGMQHSIALKDTYQVYEIWVFMQVVAILRNLEMLEDTSGLYALVQDGLVLSLSEKREHRIRLVNGGTLAYQRWFTKATRDYVAYTHGMKPDIVLESNGKLYVFDPKYRVEHNLPGALGEMHKYRDGIIRVSDGTRAVAETYIITPVNGSENNELYGLNYRSQYKMGVFSLKPSEDLVNQKSALEKKLREHLDLVTY